MEPKEAEAPGLKIVDQIRTRNAREYDLAFADARLTVNVQSVDAEPPGWRVEVRGHRRGGETITACESRPSRVEALRAVGAEWKLLASPHGLDMFDWADVERLLDGVRAL
jgi:hypothetical protein